MANILILSYDRPLSARLADALSVGGHTVEVETPDCAPASACASPIDLVIADLERGDQPATGLLRQCRSQHEQAAVLALSANRDEADAVVALLAGADHYVRKPVGLLELLARTEALLRRASAAVSGPTPRGFRDIELDATSNSVWRNGRRIPLAPMEFRLLEALINRRGAVITRSELLREVWRSSSDKRTRTIDLHISQLRRKLERDPHNRLVIETVWAHGYRLGIREQSLAS